MRTALLIALISLQAGACRSAPLQRFEYSEVAMGGRARIVVYAPDHATAERACRDAFARIADELTRPDAAPAGKSGAARPGDAPPGDASPGDARTDR
jgi:hypothetical protein